MTLPKLGPAVWVGLAGLALLWLLSRWDGAQTARLAELDRQQAAVAHQSLQASKARRATQAASEATDRENARLRAAVALREAVVARLRRRGDSLGAALTPVLAGLPDSVVFHVKLALAVKDSTIAEQDGVIHTLSTIVDSLQADRDRWAAQDRQDALLAAQWQQQAGRWEKESKRGCLPLIGCIGRSTVAIVAGGLGFVGGILAGH